uniref:TetR family transcriptional regulator n=1 Tax=Streptomyces malaysiensis TaxID=92644 RepID=UPI00142F15D9
MGRWEPDPRGRLAKAAVELFAAQGFDQTTGAQIAARAGIHERSFFRLFPDKRDVFFHSMETMRREASPSSRAPRREHRPSPPSNSAVRPSSAIGVPRAFGRISSRPIPNCASAT